MNTNTLPVANTIRAQIGSRALFMLGAENLMGDASSLTFKIRGSRVVTHIRITLDPSDTYTVDFYKCRGLKRTLVKSLSLVYGDGLNQLIESTTGLRVNL